MRINGKIVQIAGSASKEKSYNQICYGHELVKELVNNLLKKNTRFLVQVGKEEYKEWQKEFISLTFDWTIISVVNEYIEKNEYNFNPNEKPLLTVAKQDITVNLPKKRKSLWKSITGKEAIQIEFIEDGWASGALRRIRTAELGDMLIILSGGEGVEHLAVEYNRRYKPIIPFDLDLGSSKGDGSGGASKLYTKMLSNYKPFISLEDPSNAGKLFLNINTGMGKRNPREVTDGIMSLIENISPPIAFYVRLLDEKHEKYNNVEFYFRNIVDKLIIEKGYSIKEMGKGKSTNSWMNVEIFDYLNKAAIVIVDLTGLRLNCLMELGYALGLNSKVIVTAQMGTKLPFDIKMYECLFWDTSEDIQSSISKLRNYMERNLNRAPIVRKRDDL